MKPISNHPVYVDAFNSIYRHIYRDNRSEVTIGGESLHYTVGAGPTGITYTAPYVAARLADNLNLHCTYYERDYSFTFRRK